MAEQKKDHCTYDIQMHVVFVTKHRKRCICGAVEEELKNVISSTFEAQGCHVCSMQPGMDHVRMLVQFPPTVAPSDVIRTVKINSSKMARRRQGDALSEHFGDGERGLWSASYYIASAGGTTDADIDRYVESQETGEREKRKYQKHKSQYWGLRGKA